MNRFTTLGAALAITVLALTGCSPTTDDSSEGSGGAGGESEAATTASWADEKYGTFEPTTQSGTGDTVIVIPEGVTAGIVTATHDGVANFVVSGLDAANGMTLDLLVNTIGAYSGASAFGLMSIGEPSTSFQISADGNWTIAMSPLGSAVELPASGVGDGVFSYSGAPTTMALTHDGSANFSITQYDDSMMGMGLLVNEIGAYTGSVPVAAGPSIFTVTADGAWTSAAG